MQTRVTVGAGYGGVGEAALSLAATANISSIGELVNFLIDAPNSPCYVEEKNLTGADTATPDNLISIPGGVTNKVSSVIIVPDPDADFQAILKAINTAADNEGLALAKRAPSLLSFETPALPDGTNAQFYLKWGGIGIYRKTVKTVAPATDIITLDTCTATILPVGSRIKFTLGTDGVIPGGLTPDTLYYVVYSVNSGSDVDIKVALTKGGTVIDLTSAGSVVLASTCDRFRFVWL